MMDIKHYVKPASLEEAYSILSSSKKNTILGGGVWMKYTKSQVDTMIDLSLLHLDQIDVGKDLIVIGAQTPLRDLEVHPSIVSLGGGFLSQAIGSIVGVAFRNLVTIGGSIIGKYPFSDLVTVMLCLEVKLRFFPEEEMSLHDFLDQKEKHHAILTHIVIRKTNGMGYFKKVSNTSLDFSILNVACFYEGEWKIAIGSRPGKPMLAWDAMHALNQAKHVDQHVIESVGHIIIQTIPFADDERGSKAYREILAKTYVMRGIKEVMSHES
jgi:CO/xanthine dehydrogenase FAD-binding subunit